MQPHYFLAIPVPEPLQSALTRQVRKHELRFKRWVHPKDIHLTLVFLGACSTNQLEQIKKDSRSVLAKWSSFCLELSTFGTFGDRRQPRIFWAGVKNQPMLLSLREELFEVCQELGLSLEKRPFAPHITLARKWIGETDYSEYQLELQQNWQVNEIVLYESQLTGDPKYKTVESFHFGGNGS